MNTQIADNKTNLLDEMLGDLSAYEHPEYFFEEYALRIRAINIKDKAKLAKYNLLLIGARQAYNKIQKYELYFSEFYPTTEQIEKFEALEHHIHAYLEDAIIFKNKVINFIGALENDLKKLSGNKKRLEEVSTWSVDRVRKIFEGVAKHRNPHHHFGMRFIDEDLLNTEAAHFLIKGGTPTRAILRPEAVEILKKKEEDSFNCAKAKWIYLAKSNAEEMTKFINDAFGSTRKFLYQILGIKPLKEILH